MKLLLMTGLTFLFLNCSHSAQSVDGKTEQGSQVENPEEIIAQNGTFRFAIISDLNGSYGSTTYKSDVKKAVEYIKDPANKIQFAISTGDMVAGQRKNLNYKAMWEAFHSTVTRPLLKNNVPLFPSPGNHDAYVSRKTERDHYLRSWKREDVLSQSAFFQFVSGVEQNFPFQYAFKVGKVLFVALDNTDVRPWKEKTYQWLKKVFEQEKEVQVKMVYGHVPILPFAFKKETEYVSRGDIGFLNDIEGLFEEHQVDVFFSGHSHVYYPGRRDRKTQYISVPLLGSGSRYLISNDNLPRSQTGFLVVEVGKEGAWSLKHYSAKDYKLIRDSSFPEEIQMPKSNTSRCKACKSFPKAHFLDSSRRIIYRRSDQPY